MIPTHILAMSCRSAAVPPLVAAQAESLETEWSVMVTHGEIDLLARVPVEDRKSFALLLLSTLLDMEMCGMWENQ